MTEIAQVANLNAMKHLIWEPTLQPVGRRIHSWYLTILRANKWFRFAT
jgi:hypothetical protein